MTHKPARNFKLTFSLDAAQGLDAAASAVSRASDRGNWFFTFRRSMSGVTSRLYGLSRHYEGVHEWYMRFPHPTIEIEYHVASILFSMDSAIECFTYALNALGNGIEPTAFHDVTDAGALSICPSSRGA